MRGASTAWPTGSWSPWDELGWGFRGWNPRVALEEEERQALPTLWSLVPPTPTPAYTSPREGDPVPAAVGRRVMQRGLAVSGSSRADGAPQQGSALV